MNSLLEMKASLQSSCETPLEELIIVEKQLRNTPGYIPPFPDQEYVTYIRKYGLHILTERSKNGLARKLFKFYKTKQNDYVQRAKKATNSTQKKLSKKAFACEWAYFFLVYLRKQEELRKKRKINKSQTALKMIGALDLGLYDNLWFKRTLRHEDYQEYTPVDKNKKKKKKNSDSDSDSDKETTKGIKLNGSDSDSDEPKKHHQSKFSDYESTNNFGKSKDSDDGYESYDPNNFSSKSKSVPESSESNVKITILSDDDDDMPEFSPPKAVPDIEGLDERKKKIFSEAMAKVLEKVKKGDKMDDLTEFIKKLRLD